MEREGVGRVKGSAFESRAVLPPSWKLFLNTDMKQVGARGKTRRNVHRLTYVRSLVNLSYLNTQSEKGHFVRGSISARQTSCFTG